MAAVEASRAIHALWPFVKTVYGGGGRAWLAHPVRPRRSRPRHAAFLVLKHGLWRCSNEFWLCP